MNSLQEGKVVNYLQYKYDKLIGELREYPDCFEYIIIKNYENAFNFQRTECIQMDRCFVQVIKSGPSYEMISFIFFKDDWTVSEILYFLSEHRIEMFRPITEPFDIQHASEILDAKLFNQHPLVLYKKGKRSIWLDSNMLGEVTELYEQYNKINYTGLATEIDKEKFHIDYFE